AVLAGCVAALAGVAVATAAGTGGAVTTGTAVTAKTGLLSLLGAKTAMIVAGVAVVAFGAGAVYVATKPEKARTLPAAAAFAFTDDTTITAAYPVPGRPQLRVTGAGIPQVTGGDKARREAINAVLRAPVDQAVAGSRRLLERSPGLGTPGPDCAGPTLTVEVEQGLRGPKLVSVRYRIIDGLVCNSETYISYASVTADLAEATAITPVALFRPGALPDLARRLRWKKAPPESAGFCPAPPRTLTAADLELRKGARAPVVLTFLKNGLDVTQVAAELGCAEQRTRIAYSRLTDLLQPDVYAKALAVP
ncbi:MAG: hypothetical protein ABIS86_05750, partial [Streptosporangiaceae bacterium]